MPEPLERSVRLFLSHVQNKEVDDVSSEVKVISNVVDEEPVFSLWLFERSSASAESPPAHYLRGVAESEIFILLLGSEITDAVMAEARRALELQKPIWVFVKDTGVVLGPKARELHQQVKEQATYKKFSDLLSLRQAFSECLRDESKRLIRRAIQLPSNPSTKTLPWGVQQGQSSDHDYAPALRILSKALGDAEENRLQAVLDRARDHLSSGRYSQAYELYQRLKEDESVLQFPEIQFKILNNLSLAARGIGKGAVALEASRKAVKLKPDNLNGRLTHLGNLVTSRSRGWKREFKSNQEFLETSPAGLQLLGAVAYQEGNLAGCIGASERALAVDSLDDSSRLNIAFASMQLADFPRAEQVLNQIGPESVFYIQAQVGLAEVKHRRARESDDPHRLLDESIRHIENAETGVAARNLSREDWLETSAHAAVVRSSVCLLRGKAEEAIGILETHKTDIPVALYHFHSGQSYAALDKWDEALEHFEAAVKLDDSNLDVVSWLGMAYLTRYEATRDETARKKAEQTFKRVLRDEVRGDAVGCLSELLIEVGRIEEARRVIELALCKKPEDSDVLVAAFRLEFRTGQEEKALNLAQQIYAKRPREVVSATYLGMRDFKNGQYEDSVVKLKDAIADPFCRSSFHAESYFYLALALKRLKKLTDAIDIALSGMKRYPKSRRLAKLLDILVERA